MNEWVCEDGRRDEKTGAKRRSRSANPSGAGALSVSTSTALFELRDSRVEFRSEPQAACATAPCLRGNIAATNSRRSRPRPEDLPLVWDCSEHTLVTKAWCGDRCGLLLGRTDRFFCPRLREPDLHLQHRTQWGTCLSHLHHGAEFHHTRIDGFTDGSSQYCPTTQRHLLFSEWRRGDYHSHAYSKWAADPMR